MLRGRTGPRPDPPPVDPARVAARRERRRAAGEVLAVAAVVAGLIGSLWLARGELGMTWDEPYFFERQHDVRDWLARVAGSPRERQGAFSREGLERAWRFCRAVPDQHPPVPALLSLVTGVVAEGLLGPLRAYRLSTVLLFSLAAGVLFRLVRTRWGWVPALAAAGTLVFNPRLLGDAQQITADVDTGAFWFLSAVSFLDSCETGRAPWRFGVLAGLAIMCKATGVLVLPAVALWAVLARPPGWGRPLAWSLPTVPAAMLAVNPAWWPAPVWGMARWVQAFLHYPQKVPVLYLGRVYDSMRTFLPWHNTVVLAAVMVPVGLLVLAAIGLVSAAWTGLFRRGPSRLPSAGPSRLSDASVAGWAAANFLTPMVMRMFSFMPAHDGLRQLVPAFFFLALLASYGAYVLAGHVGRSWRGLGAVVVLLCVGSAGWETVRIHPYELSYYNLLIGGPRGAKAAGMESTYFWDTATAEVLDWMNAHLPRDATVLIFPPPNVHTFSWEQRWGRLRRDLRFVNFDDPDFRARVRASNGPYMIFQMRQGLYLPRFPGQKSRFVPLADAPALFELAPARAGGIRLLAIFGPASLEAILNDG